MKIRISSVLALLVFGASAPIARAAHDPLPSSLSEGDAPALADAPASLDEAVGLVRVAYDGIASGGDWMVVAGAGLSLVVLGLRRFGRRPLPVLEAPILPTWFLTDRGGVVLVFALAVLGSIAHGLAAHAPFGLATLVAAAKVGLVAIGGYAGLRRFLWPQIIESAPPEPPATPPTPPLRAARGTLPPPIPRRGTV